MSSGAAQCQGPVPAHASTTDQGGTKPLSIANNAVGEQYVEYKHFFLIAQYSTFQLPN